MAASIMGIFAFLIGASVGSFLNVAADRLPRGKSIVRPRSFCDSCQRPIASIDMIPILSYLLIRGRCRYCKSRIPLRVMLVELVTGVLFVAIYLQFGLGPEFVVLCAAMSLMVAVTLIDLEHGLILNAMVYPSLLVLLALAPFWPEFGLDRGFFGIQVLAGSLANSVLAGLGGFALFLIIALINPGGMGGGDVKFAGVLGLLLGFPGILLAFWISVITGGIAAITLLVTKRKGRKDAMPFGPFMALGGAVILLAGDNVVDWYQDLSDALAGVWT